MELQKIVEQTQKGPNAKQKAWLETQIAALTPDALAFLQQTIDDAVLVLDLRSMIIASAVAERIKKGAIPTSDRMKEVKNKVFAGAPGRVYWKVGTATATKLEGEVYSEQTSGGMASIAAKPGSHLLRVNSVIQSVSTGKDAPFTKGVFDGVKGLLAGFGPDVTVNGVTTKWADVMAGPYRWIDDSLIFLVTPSGDLIQCGFSVQGSDLRGMPEIGIPGKGVFGPPHAAKPSDEVRFTGIFPVPNELDNKALKLLVLGAGPVSLSDAPPVKKQ